MPTHPAWEDSRFVSAFTRDLVRPLENYEPDVRRRFFVERQLEKTLLSSRVDEIKAYGGNVLVVGDRGSGKSGFLRWFLEDGHFGADAFVDLIDLRAIGSTMEESAFLFQLRGHLANAAKKLLKFCADDPCHDFTEYPKSGDEALFLYTNLTRRMTEAVNGKKRMFLFIDDIDWLDRMFPQFVSHLKPFLLSHNCSVVLAARRPAYNALLSDNDFMIGQFFKAEHTVELGHVRVEQILFARLETIRNEKTDPTLIQRILPTFYQLFSDDSTGAGAPKAVEFPDDIPFTDKQLEFIQAKSNGRIVDMLTISRRFIEFMLEHKDSLQSASDGKKKIGRDRLIDHFSNNEIGELRIRDLHERKSYDGYTRSQMLGVRSQDVGHSLYVLLLETLLDFGSINETHRKRLETFGFSQQELTEGLVDLFQQGMIDEKCILDTRALGNGLPDRPDYVLTPRGRYYISYLVHWDEYIERFGRSKHHLTARDAKSRELLRRAVLQYLAALRSVLLVSDEYRGESEIKIQKKGMLNHFSITARDLLVWANRNDMSTPLAIDIQMLSELLMELKVITTYALAEHDSFIIHLDKVLLACTRTKTPPEAAVPFFYDTMLKFAESRMVSKPRR